jgi:2C-methyl-D-erythritol 2,4-cyclodiphosphate synthase
MKRSNAENQKAYRQRQSEGRVWITAVGDALVAILVASGLHHHYDLTDADQRQEAFDEFLRLLRQRVSSNACDLAMNTETTITAMKISAQWKSKK